MNKSSPTYPNCDACGRPTTLLRSEQHPKFANMMERYFVCRCGTFTSDIVAQTKRRPGLPAKTSPVAQSA